MRPGDAFILLAAFIVGGIAIGFPLGILLHWLKGRRQWNKIINAVEAPIRSRPKPPPDNVSTLVQKPARKKDAA